MLQNCPLYKTPVHIKLFRSHDYTLTYCSKIRRSLEESVFVHLGTCLKNAHLCCKPDWKWALTVLKKSSMEHAWSRLAFNMFAQASPSTCEKMWCSTTAEMSITPSSTLNTTGSLPEPGRHPGVLATGSKNNCRSQLLGRLRTKAFNISLHFSWPLALRILYRPQHHFINNASMA